MYLIMMVLEKYVLKKLYIVVSIILSGMKRDILDISSNRIVADIPHAVVMMAIL